MAENRLDSSQLHVHLNPRASYILHHTLQSRWHISLYDPIIFLTNLHYYTPKELTGYRPAGCSDPVSERHCPPSPVDGTIVLLYLALLSQAISSEIKALTTTKPPLSPLIPGSCLPCRLHPPSPGALMDVLACKTTYETLNNNNVVISHSLFHRASI